MYAQNFGFFIRNKNNKNWVIIKTELGLTGRNIDEEMWIAWQ